MTIGTIIVQNALQKIGAHSDVAPAGAAALQSGFKILLSMISLWRSEGLDIGANLLASISSELNEKQDCTNAIEFNLAIMISPDFDNGATVVSQTLQGQARSQFKRINSLYKTFSVPSKVVSSTLPKGQGNDQYGRYQNAFFNEGDTIGN